MSASLTKSFSMPIFVKAWEPKLIASILGSVFSSLVTSIFYDSLYFSPILLYDSFIFPWNEDNSKSAHEGSVTQIMSFFRETLFSISDLFKLFLFLKTSNMKYSLKNVIIARYLIKSKNVWKLFTYFHCKPNGKIDQILCKEMNHYVSVVLSIE